MNTNVLPFKGSIWTQKLPLMLWEKNGRVMWAESVVGMTNKVFPLSTVAWPMAKSAHWGRSSPVIDQRKMERGSEICSELHSECQCECSQPGYYKNEIFLILLCLTAGTYVPPTPHPCRKTAESSNFSVTKEDDAHQYVIRNPLNKEGMKPRTIHKIQYLVAPCALQHRYRHNALKK